MISYTQSTSIRSDEFQNLFVLTIFRIPRRLEHYQGHTKAILIFPVESWIFSRVSVWKVEGYQQMMILRLSVTYQQQQWMQITNDA